MKIIKVVLTLLHWSYHPSCPLLEDAEDITLHHQYLFSKACLLDPTASGRLKILDEYKIAYWIGKHKWVKSDANPLILN